MSKISNIGYTPAPKSFVKPKQSIDIFKKRMEEAFQFPDELKHELQNSSMKQTKITLLQVSGILFLLILLFSGVFLTKNFLAKPVFCTADQSENCQKCPEHSTCTKDSFACLKNYVKEGLECVEDQTITQKAYILLHKAENYIIDKSTKQYLQDRSRFYSAITELKYLFQDSDSIDEKFIELLVTGRSQRLTMEYFNGEEVFFAKVPFLDLFSLIWLFWDENFYSIIFALFLLFAAIFKLIQVKQARVLGKKAQHMYELIRNQLKANIDDTPEHGVPEETLKEAIVSHLGQASASSLWPAIENLRKADKQVSKFETSLAGRPAILWQWKDIRSTKPLGRT